MEDLQKKAIDDELNKAYDEIGRSPKKKIPVPKVYKNEKEQENKTKNYS